MKASMQQAEQAQAGSQGNHTLESLDCGDDTEGSQSRNACDVGRAHG